MALSSLNDGALSRAWRAVANRYPSYDLVLPGAHSFICRAATCNAWCCRSLSVPLGDADVERMARVSGLPAFAFLESENGEPIALPLADPYLLVRKEGACALLGDDLACQQYEGRPAACRLYPYQALLLDEESGRPAQWGSMAGAVALLLRHRECPGFTGPPMPEEEWAHRLAEAMRLQFEHGDPQDWSGRPGTSPGNVEETAAGSPDSQV